MPSTAAPAQPAAAIPPQHTPGPWEALPTVPSDGFDCWTIQAADGELAWSKGYQNEAVRQANARLIAAAPTLYEYASRRAAVGDNEAARILESINAGF